MAKENLGKIMMTPKGEYNNTVAYVFLDIVTYNGGSYVCKQASTGNDPTNIEYWQIIAEKGNMPVLGEDYFTEEDKEEMVNAVSEGAMGNFDTYYDSKVEEFDAHNEHIITANEDLFNALPSNVASGINLVIGDAKDCRLMSTVIKGICEQKVRSGKNLLDLSKCTFSSCILNEDGTITSNIDNAYYSYIETTELNEFLMNNLGKATTFSTGTIIEDKLTSIAIFGTMSDGSTYQEYSELGTGKCTLTISEKFTEITSVQLRFNINSSEAFTDTTSTIAYAQLEVGDTASEYEAYGASPSPNYPSEIKTNKGIVNLFDKDNPNLCNLYPGSTFSYKSTFRSLYIEIEPNKTYTIFKGVYNNADVVVGSSIEIPVEGGAVTNTVSSATNVPLTITTGENDKYLTVYYNSTDTNIENVRNSIMIEEGTIAHNWVPYGNSLNIVTTGKNLFDYDNSTFKSYYSAPPTKENNGFLGGCGYYIYLKENIPAGTYTLSFKVANADNGTTAYIQIRDSLKTVLKSVNIHKSNSITFTTNTDISYLVIDNGHDSITTLLYDIQIEVGEVATEYEPYKENLAPIDLQDNELCSIGDVKDELIISNGKAKIIKRIGKIVLDGVTNKLSYYGAYGVDGAPLFFLSLSNIITKPSYKEKWIISDSYASFTISEDTAISMPNYNIRGATSSSRIYIRDDRYSSEDEINSELSQNPVTVYYELLEPYEIDLGTITNLPRTFENITNNISVESNIENSELEVKYVLDIKMYVDNLINS